MSRQYAKSRAARHLGMRPETLPGMGRVVCGGCGHELVFAAAEYPEKCHLCGTPTKPAFQVCTMNFTALVYDEEGQERVVTPAGKLGRNQRHLARARKRVRRNRGRAVHDGSIHGHPERGRGRGEEELGE